MAKAKPPPLSPDKGGNLMATFEEIELDKFALRGYHHRLILIFPMRKTLLLSLAVAASVAAVPTASAYVYPPSIGGARDAYGCPTAAGYTWCPVRQQCIRPWEQRCELQSWEVRPIINNYACPWRYGHSYENCVYDETYFPWSQPVSIPRETTIPAPRIDAHGCVLSEHQQWCAVENRCINRLTERCAPVTQTPISDYYFLRVNGGNVADCTTLADGSRTCTLRYEECDR
jgi:hypothetical protein